MMTHDQIAKQLNTTPERVALIERTALRKLARHPIIRDLYRQHLLDTANHQPKHEYAVHID